MSAPRTCDELEQLQLAGAICHGCGYALEKATGKLSYCSFCKSCDQLGVCQDRTPACKGCKQSEGARTVQTLLRELGKRPLLPLLPRVK